MKSIGHQKQEPVSINTKSLNRYPIIQPQKSDEIQPIEIYDISTVVLDDMLLSKQANNIDLFFRRGRHCNIDINCIFQSYFQLPKMQYVIIVLLIFYLSKI